MLEVIKTNPLATAFIILSTLQLGFNLLTILRFRKAEKKIGDLIYKTRRVQ